MFDIDPDKPNIPALARILAIMGMFLLVASIGAMMLAFSGYEWINEIYAVAAAVGAFLIALVFFAQGKIIEQLAVVSARVKSRFAIDAAVKTLQATGAAPSAGVSAPSPSPAPNTAWSGPKPKERVIHVPDDQARQSGFNVR
jgi:hypothetical protein